MFKNIILNYTYPTDLIDLDNFTNEIRYQVPFSFLGYNQYKIESARIVFDGKGRKLGLSGNAEVFGDILNYQQFAKNIAEAELDVKACYVVSNKTNNAELNLDNAAKFTFNMICCSFNKMALRNEFMLDSDWFDSREIFYFSFYDQDFMKISLKEVYINIKLRYDQ